VGGSAGHFDTYSLPVSEYARTEHGRWPDPSDELILHAALDEPDQALAAWQGWLAGCDPDALSRPARRALPCAAENLRPLGVEHPLLLHAEELREQYETENRERMATLVELAQVLGAAGIEVLALKGVVLIAEYYRDPGLRQMSDVDLMVRASDTANAARALADAGWSPSEKVGSLGPYLHAQNFSADHQASQLDLHQYLTEFGSSPEAEREMFQRARPFEILGVKVLAQSPADLFLSCCIRSVKIGRFRNNRWVLDVAAILDVAGETLDWEAVAAQAESRAMTLPLCEALGYLRSEFEMKIPGELIDRLRRFKTGSRERRRYRAFTRYPQTLVEIAELYAALYETGVSAQGRCGSLVEFARFSLWQLEQRMGVERRAELPGRIVSALVGRARRSARPAAESR